MVQHDLVEPHEKLISSLGRLVKDHTTLGEHPLDLTLAEPLPSNVRFYLFNVSETDRSTENLGDEFSINVRFYNEYDIAKPDRSDESLVILGGYEDEEDVFVFWDDDLYYDYGSNENPYKPYTYAAKHEEAVTKGFATRPRSHEERGRGGETVISARPDHVVEAIRMRDRLIEYRNILDDYFPEGWDDNSKQRQQLERVVDEFLTNTDLSNPIHERRLNAQRAVANAQGVNLSTIQEKCGRRLWDEPTSEGYQKGPFDSALEELEAEWRSGDAHLQKKTWTQPDPIFTDRDLPSTVDKLYFPLDSSDGPTVFEQITTALASGNHLILTGPPGAGKTELAEAACEHYVDRYELTTATNDWSTFDTIGGYHQSGDGELAFQPGVVLQRFMDPDIPEAKNEWLIIDELNRADIDKAFGSLFSALTETTVTLPFENEDEDPITLVGNPGESGTTPLTSNRYYIPDEWRLIATINSADKASLYRMSYAFMRRFAFISVPVPTEEEINPNNDPSILPNYIQHWEVEFPGADAVENLSGDVEDVIHDDLEEIWHGVQRIRPIGPGIIEDVLDHVLTQINQTGQLTYEHAFVAHILPQLDGQSEDDLSELVRQLNGRLPDDRFDDHVAKRFAREYLGLDLEGDDEA